jgi:hypothetical protein
MKDKTRIYLVEHIDGSETRLVRAVSRFIAHRHVTLSTYEARLATQDDLEILLSAGVTVESARPDPDTADLFQPATAATPAPVEYPTSG